MAKLCLTNRAALHAEHKFSWPRERKKKKKKWRKILQREREKAGVEKVEERSANGGGYFKSLRIPSPSPPYPLGVKFRGGITRIPPAAEEFVGFKINSRVKCDCARQRGD